MYFWTKFDLDEWDSYPQFKCKIWVSISYSLDHEQNIVVLIWCINSLPIDYIDDLPMLRCMLYILL